MDTKPSDMVSSIIALRLLESRLHLSTPPPSPSPSAEFSLSIPLGHLGPGPGGICVWSYSEVRSLDG